ncbi:MAG TPA: aromatic ring-hydroxylating dioxygenase subunit alpha [Gaiellales bacterium]|jgi:Rieske 2Fe-2S family protein|nr:aromatic ring-hydroxylating dioxygenase subunit alpha [Gaiellales bacterium]
MAVQIGVSELPALGLSGYEYTSPEHFARELDRFWRPGWRFACHESEIAGRGQYVRYDLAGDSVIVVRGDDGEVHALHNVCRHRGSRVVEDGRGVCRARLVCPYHGWSYDLDGTVRTTPKMHEGFDRTGWDLKRAWAEIWNGMVFVSLAKEQPRPIAERLAGADFSGYELGRLKIAWEREYVVDANWKVAWENGLECYHCALNHPELCRVWPMDDYGDQLNAREVAEYDYIPDRPNLPGVERNRGGRVIRREDDPTTGSTAMQWHLGMFEMFAGTDGVYIGSFHPLTPVTTAIRVVTLVREDAVEGADYTDEAFRISEVTREEDNALVAVVQRGVASAAYEPGPFNERLEAANRVFMQVYRDVMREP